MDIASLETVYTVSMLNQEIHDFFDSHLFPLWVSGEISNFSSPASGHWYFTLKDEKSAVRCAFFQPRLRGIRFKPENGMQVLLHARPSLYTARGDFQLIGDAIEAAGDGLLQKAFNALKEKLQAEGLFEACYKKTLPAFPETIGVVTSPTGAAIHDILTILDRRFPLIKIIIYPCLVQGNAASQDIVSAITIANIRKECDVLIVGRGGGSLEDLWPFNEEIVARAIFKSTIPVISAVGHEIDFTIADFVADVRAPTPSAAAELISPDKTLIAQELKQYQARLFSFIQQIISQKQQNLSHLMPRLRHPKQKLLEQAQSLDNTEARLKRAVLLLSQQKQQQLNLLSRALHAISPLATLDRGYAVLQKKNTSKIISMVSDVTAGDAVIARLKDGALHCEIKTIEHTV